MEKDINLLKYPIGKFQKPEKMDQKLLDEWINRIEEFPKILKDETIHLNEDQLNQPYRPDGWTVKQIVNHCADSHMNSFIGFKLALTEDLPTIKPYFENLWAELPDSKNYPIQDALNILEGLHARWTNLLKNLTESDWEREFIHPETMEKIALKTNLGIYAWHCQHHLAHIKLAIIR